MQLRATVHARALRALNLTVYVLVRRALLSLVAFWG